MPKILDKKQKKVLEQMEELDAMGQEDDDKAVSPVQEYTKKKKQEDIEYEGRKTEELIKKSKWGKEYVQSLRDMVMDIALRTMDVPKRWGVRPFFDDKGVGIYLTDPSGRKFIRAFRPCHDAKYDLAACSTLCLSAQNFIDASEQEGMKTPGGVYLPN